MEISNVYVILIEEASSAAMLDVKSHHWLKVTRSAYTHALFICLKSERAVNNAYCNPSVHISLKPLDPFGTDKKYYKFTDYRR